MTEIKGITGITGITAQPVTVRGAPRDKAPESTLFDAPIIGERYWSPEFAAREWEAAWPRVWQVAGRIDQVAEAGDHVTHEIGRDSVLAVRGSDGVAVGSLDVSSERAMSLWHADIERAQTAVLDHDAGRHVLP